MTTIESVFEVLGAVFAIAGALVLVSAGIGLVRFADAYMRISAVATATGIGISLVITGVVLSSPALDTVVKGALAIALQLATSGVAGIVLARGALLSGHTFRPDTDTAALDPADPD